MKKTFDWVTKLDKYFDDCASRRFEYGVFDCALFTADGVKAMTGVDVAAEFRGGLYCDKAGAHEAIREASTYFTGNGVGSEFQALVVGLAKDHSIPEVSRGFQGRGSIALIETPGGESLGLIDLSGLRIYSVTQPRGLVAVPISAGFMFWSINE